MFTEGYTSITVREPLAHIKHNKITTQDGFDSHYTVLSDDSGLYYYEVLNFNSVEIIVLYFKLCSLFHVDEMYAAIQEAYTSGSETYAQIQPLPLIDRTYCSVPETVSEASSSQIFGASSVHSRQGLCICRENV